VSRGRVRRQPQRTCIVCREADAKRSLVRVVRTPEGRVVVDPKGKMPGRGAYLHARRECWSAARRGSILRQALRLGTLDGALLAEDLAAIDAYFERLEAQEDAEASRPPDAAGKG